MLKLSRAQLQGIELHGEQTYPRECCGVLVGRRDEAGNKTVARVVACTNTHTNPAQDYFSIAPLELMKIEREADRDGLELLGFYHSHPDWPARPSDSDLAEAHWTGCSYVITSVLQGKAVATNSFELQGEEEEKALIPEELAADTAM